SREPSVTALRQEVGGDGPCRVHGHGTGPARGRITAAPADEHGQGARRRGQGHHRAAVVGGRAGGPAVDPRGTGCDSAADDARFVDREGEGLRGKGGGDRPCRTHGHGTGHARDRIASAPAGEGGTCGRNGGQSNGGPAGIVRGTARRARPAVDPWGIGGHGAAASASLADRAGVGGGRVGGAVYEHRDGGG